MIEMLFVIVVLIDFIMILSDQENVMLYNKNSNDKPASESQFRCLEEMGIETHPTMTYSEANTLIRQNNKAYQNLPSPQQMKTLRRAPYER